MAVVALSFASVARAGMADAVVAALADAQTRSAAERLTTRYLWLGAVAAQDRDGLRKVLGFWCNALSREPTIVVPRQVSPDLLAVDLLSYGWPHDVWESLAEADVYFHVKLQEGGGDPAKARVSAAPAGGLGRKARLIVEAPAGATVTVNGKAVGRELTTADLEPGRVYTYEVEVSGFADGSIKVNAEMRAAFETRVTVVGGGGGAGRRTNTALAPWLGDKTTVARLVEVTQSQAPIVRGDWFFQQTAVAADRKPGYYDFLGLANQKAMEDLAGLDRKAKAAVFRELREAVAVSIVTQKPRRIAAYAAISGRVYQTFDSAKAVDKHNPLRVLDDALEHDASEIFFRLPNDLWGTFLVSAKGERQDTAPDTIASDATASGPDRRVHVGLSCYRCHSDGGLQNIDGWARQLFQPPRALSSPDPAKLKELERWYMREIAGPINDDRAVFARALKTANGLEPKENAKLLGQVWYDYIDRPVTVDIAARECGVSKDAFLKALEGQARLGTLDTVLSTFLVPQGPPVGREQWQEVFPLAMQAIGVRP